MKQNKRVILCQFRYDWVTHFSVSFDLNRLKSGSNFKICLRKQLSRVSPPDVQMTVQIAVSFDLNLSFCLHPLSWHHWAHICVGLCKCAQVQEFTAAKVFSNKHCPTADFHCRTTPGSRYQTPWQDDYREREKGEESGIEMSDHRGVSASILQGIYSCADVCICQVLTVNFRAGCRQPSVVWELSGWAVLMAACGVLEGERYVCISYKQLFPRK